MSSAVVTLATGQHERLLEIARPSFEAFADRHGHDLVIAEPFDIQRPPAWQKLPLLRDLLLSGYESVLWLDADVVIVDDTEDVVAPDGCWQTLVEHHTNDGLVPNTGVWLARPPMVPVFEQMWRMVEYVQHPWWEQAALVALMGYHGQPLKADPENEVHAHTCFLDAGWNVHRDDVNRSDRERFMHATMHPDREATMREWAAA